MEKNSGFTDQAAVKDLFDIKKYTEGLTQFISTCNTPMTISIQGSWGTGKTSIMQIVKGYLGSNIQTVWFNTWQFSQFNLEDKLPLVMLSKLVSAVSDNKSEQAKNLVKKVFEGISRIAVGYVTGGATNGEEIKELFSQDFIGQLDSLKESFQSLVNQRAGENGRVVIFVDDLDRLEPRKAVELLEVLKLFLDCENCVFVLAIDYDVVCRGVEAKYGKLSDEKTPNENKGKSFFDKIIQVPFKMPVAEYNIKNYIKSCFEEIGITCSPEELAVYEDLIRKSIGVNPRSMKRLFNAYLLLKIVVTDAVLRSDENKLLLFAVLCLQHAFEKTYEYLVRNRNDLKSYDLSILESGEFQDVKERITDFKISENEFIRLRPFMESFVSLIKKNNDNGISDDELQNLVNVLGISSLTSAGDESKPRSSKTEVSDIHDLNLGGNDISFLQKMIDAVKGVAPDIRESLRNNKTPKVDFKNQNGRGQTFVEFFVFKKSYDVYFTGCDDVFKTPENAEILKSRKVRRIQENSSKNFYIRFRVYENDSELSDLRVLAKACYESFGEQI
ncbi:MAG: P-loop NTPase fold protein [Oscillospiraceae bacterium]|nr:P-loop NTPase fold protein [Oscillospiraceae bacterium]